MIYTTLLNIAVFQGTVLGFLLLKTPLFKNSSNKYIAYLLFTLSILLLTHVWEIEDTYSSYPLLHFIEDIQWVFLLPAFLFLFIIEQIDTTFKNKSKLYLYFFPFIYSAVLTIVNNLDYIAGIYTIPKSAIFIVQIAGLIQLITAVIFIPFALLYAFSLLKHIKDAQQKKWVTTLFIFISSLVFSWLITCLVGLFLNYETTSTMSVIALLVTFFIYWTAYRGIYKYNLARNKEAIFHFLMNDLTVSRTNLQIPKNTTRDETKETITAENLYFQKLELLCKEQQLYTDSTLNREKVAEELGISAGYLSQIINTITGENFAHYINQYRVEAVKEMISNTDFDNYNLLAMGLESGFTSKTTFYKAFKKFTGQTPNEYKNTRK
ncbi:helix-turn-helix domain-containing protein [Myroides odoratus]|uniref:helix-turn-helix domain-containing protein n=1 Tax=Myroides odoratus TaxID=256 RepID=UPI0039AF165D